MSNYNNGSNEEKRVPWSRSHFFSPQNSDLLEDVVLDITGFVQYIGFRTANTANGEKTVCDVSINAYIGDSKVRRYFGEYFVRDDHRVSIRMSYWGFSAENIKKMSLGEGDIVQVMLHSMELCEGTTAKNKTYKYVSAKTSDELDIISRAKKKSAENGQTGYANTSTSNGQQLANASPAYQTPPASMQQTAPQPQQPAQYAVAPQQPAQYAVAPQQPAQYAAAPQQPAQYAVAPQQPAQYAVAPQQPVQYAAAPRQPAQYTPAPQPSQPEQSLICSDCKTVIDANVAEYSTRRFGRYLCRDCQRKAPKSNGQQYGQTPAQAQVAPQPQQAAPQSVPGYICSNCRVTIDDKVADFSKRKYGRCLCRTCQSNVGRTSTASQQPAQGQSFANVGGVDLFEELDGVDSSNPFYN